MLLNTEVHQLKVKYPELEFFDFYINEFHDKDKEIIHHILFEENLFYTLEQSPDHIILCESLFCAFDDNLNAHNNLYFDTEEECIEYINDRSDEGYLEVKEYQNIALDKLNNKIISLGNSTVSNVGMALTVVMHIILKEDLNWVSGYKLYITNKELKENLKEINKSKSLKI